MNFALFSYNTALLTQAACRSENRTQKKQMGFSNGRWWPIFVPDFYGPRCSQHPFDPYSLTHVLHGFLFFVILVTIPETYFHEIKSMSLPWLWISMGGGGIAIILEVIWEIVENSDFIKERFRKTSGVSGNYSLDFFAVTLKHLFLYFILRLAVTIEISHH